MNEPIDQKTINDKKVKIDRDLLNATLNSWLMPGTTGTLTDNRQKNTKKENDKTPQVIYLGDGNKKGSD